MNPANTLAQLVGESAAAMTAPSPNRDINRDIKKTMISHMINELIDDLDVFFTCKGPVEITDAYMLSNRDLILHLLRAARARLHDDKWAHVRSRVNMYLDGSIAWIESMGTMDNAYFFGNSGYGESFDGIVRPGQYQLEKLINLLRDFRESGGLDDILRSSINPPRLHAVVRSMVSSETQNAASSPVRIQRYEPK